MICVTVARPERRQMAADHHFLAGEGVSLVELRLDHLQAEGGVETLLTDRPTSVIVTVRRVEDGGVFCGTEERRRNLLRSAMLAGAEYVDLEDGVAGEIPRLGTSRRLVSYHNFLETPENLEEIYDRMAAQDADVVKIVCMAKTPTDNVRILDLVAKKRNEKVPVVGFCMGEMGKPSRILCQGMGSPFTYCAFAKGAETAPGMIPWDVMRDLYHAETLTPEMEVFGVIADPVGHSMSPVIHNSAFIEKNLPNRVYLPLLVPPEMLADFMREAPKKWNLRGLSVTIPHKEKIIPFLERVDASVRAVGACNTVLWNADGTCEGTNTDYQAAMSSFAETMPMQWVEPIDDPETGEVRAKPILGKTALILGAGGVGKALAIGLARRGAKLVITDVDLPRATDLATRLTAKGYPAETVEWSARHETDADFLVNCTPLGMFPKVENTPYDVDKIRTEQVCFDAVYNPEETLFIRSAREKGCATVNGLQMFVRQAGLQFERFTEIQPPLETMRNVVKESLK